MDYRILWIHGIGPYSAGYSVAWEQVYNPYLNFPDTDYLEVLWRDVFTSAGSSSGSGTNEINIPLTPQEQVAEAEVRKALTTVFLARATAQLQSPTLLGTWSAITSKAAAGQALVPYWLAQPDAFLGEFVFYLVNRSVRNAIKEKAKAQLRMLANSGDKCSFIAHSWGTVVAYESLIDLEVELPTLHLTNLFTLGCPLWLVHYLLDDRSGRKPRNVGTWVNIHAQGDPIGSGLTPGFQVDEDHAVPNFGGSDAHESYFLDGNVAVQRDIVATHVLG